MIHRRGVLKTIAGAALGLVGLRPWNPQVWIAAQTLQPVCPSQDWPEGDGGADYDFWSPLILNYDDCLPRKESPPPSVG